MFCPDCGNRNPDENRFCGMCGATLPERNVRTERSTPPHAAAPPAHTEKWVEAPAERDVNPVPAAREPVRAAREERRPAGSLLGLGSVADDSEYVEYEEPRREVSWRFWALMLVILGVAVLFGLQWRAHQLRAQQPQQEKTAPGQVAAPESSAPPPVAPEEGNIIQSEEPSVPTEPASTPTQPAPEQQQAAPEAKPEEEKPKPEPPKREEAEEEPQEESAAAPAPAREFSDAPVRIAESHIATGECAAALGVLREAAAEQNPRALTKLGAMYLTGTCVTQDRAAAYGWFTQAQQADPGNRRLESTRRMVWAQMSDEERERVER